MSKCTLFYLWGKLGKIKSKLVFLSSITLFMLRILRNVHCVIKSDSSRIILSEINSRINIKLFVVLINNLSAITCQKPN